jgi:hypothetical protein
MKILVLEVLLDFDIVLTLDGTVNIHGKHYIRDCRMTSKKQ